MSNKRSQQHMNSQLDDESGIFEGEESSRIPQDLEFGEGNYEAIHLTCEAIGQIIESWGFKKIMGMTWAFLYLCPEPACAKDMCKALNVSPALVSITLQELLRWQVVKKISPIGKRRDYYVAEHDLWKMLSKIVEYREKPQVEIVEDKLNLALGALDNENRSRPDLKSKRTCQFQRVRIEDLKKISNTAKMLMDQMTEKGSADLLPLNNVLQPYFVHTQQLGAKIKN